MNFIYKFYKYKLKYDILLNNLNFQIGGSRPSVLDFKNIDDKYDELKGYSPIYGYFFEKINIHKNILTIFNTKYEDLNGNEIKTPEFKLDNVELFSLFSSFFKLIHGVASPSNDFLKPYVFGDDLESHKYKMKRFGNFLGLYFLFDRISDFEQDELNNFFKVLCYFFMSSVILVCKQEYNNYKSNVKDKINVSFYDFYMGLIQKNKKSEISNEFINSIIKNIIVLDNISDSIKNESEIIINKLDPKINNDEINRIKINSEKRIRNIQEKKHKNHVKEFNRKIRKILFKTNYIYLQMILNIIFHCANNKQGIRYYYEGLYEILNLFIDEDYYKIPDNFDESYSYLDFNADRLDDDIIVILRAFNENLNLDDQSFVFLNDNQIRYPDCGTINVRNLIKFIISRQFKFQYEILEKLKADEKLIKYFKKYNDEILLHENPQLSRNEWGELLINLPGVKYNREIKLKDKKLNFEIADGLALDSKTINILKVFQNLFPKLNFNTFSDLFEHINTVLDSSNKLEFNESINREGYGNIRIKKNSDTINFKLDKNHFEIVQNDVLMKNFDSIIEKNKYNLYYYIKFSNYIDENDINSIFYLHNDLILFDFISENYLKLYQDKNLISFKEREELLLTIFRYLTKTFFNETLDELFDFVFIFLSDEIILKNLTKKNIKNLKFDENNEINIYKLSIKILDEINKDFLYDMNYYPNKVKLFIYEIDSYLYKTNDVIRQESQFLNIFINNVNIESLSFIYSSNQFNYYDELKVLNIPNLKLVNKYLKNLLCIYLESIDLSNLELDLLIINSLKNFDNLMPKKCKFLILNKIYVDYEDNFDFKKIENLQYFKFLESNEIKFLLPESLKILELNYTNFIKNIIPKSLISLKIKLETLDSEENQYLDELNLIEFKKLEELNIDISHPELPKIILPDNLKKLQIKYFKQRINISKLPSQLEYLNCDGIFNESINIPKNLKYVLTSDIHLIQNLSNQIQGISFSPLNNNGMDINLLHLKSIKTLDLSFMEQKSENQSIILPKKISNLNLSKINELLFRNIQNKNTFIETLQIDLFYDFYIIAQQLNFKILNVITEISEVVKLDSHEFTINIDTLIINNFKEEFCSKFIEMIQKGKFPNLKIIECDNDKINQTLRSKLSKEITVRNISINFEYIDELILPNIQNIIDDYKKSYEKLKFSFNY